MRKKCLVTIIMIIMLSCAVATSFAIDNAKVATPIGDTQFNLTTVLPSDLYAPLNSPQLVAVNNDYVAVLSNEEVTIIHGGDYSKFKLTIKDGYYPKSIAITANYLLALFEFNGGDSTYLSLWNLQTKTLVNTDFNAILGEDNACLRIDADMDKFYLHNSNMQLLELKITDDVAESAKMKYSTVTMAKAKLFDMHNGQLYTYNGETKQICAIVKDAITQNDTAVLVLGVDDVTKFNMSEQGFVYVTANKVNYYSIKSSSVLLPYETKYSNSAYLFNDKIYFCDTASDSVKILKIDSAVEDSGLYYGDSGSAVGRLDSPSDIVVNDDKVYIADTNNNRISIFDTQTKTTTIASLKDIKPLKIAVYNQNVAVYDGNSVGIYQYVADKITLIKTLPFNQYGKLLSIAYHYNQLYALCEDGKLLSLGEEVIKVYENSNAKSIISNSNSNHIYIVADKLIKLNAKTLAEDFVYDFDFSDVSKLAIDYSGAIFALNTASDKLLVYKRINDAYTFSAQHDINRISANNSIAMDTATGDIYIADGNMHKLAHIDAKSVGSVSLNNIGYDNPKQEQWTLLQVGSVTENTFIYTAPNNDEAIEDIAENTIFLALCNVVYGEQEFSYGVVKGQEKFCYLLASKLSPIQKVQYADNHPTMTAVFPSGVTVREFPIASAKVIGAPKRPIELKLIDNVAGSYNEHIWQWYKVSYKTEDGKVAIGYVEKDDVYYSSAVTPPKNRVFLKVQTEGLGKTIKFYKEPNEESEVLLDNVADGEKVILAEEIFNKSSQFTKVVYNNTIGYIATANLLQTGLTSSQTITIVVSVVCVVIFIVLIVLLSLRKKMFNKSSNRNKIKKND